MHCLSGKVIVNKAGRQVAYCAQNPCETIQLIHKPAGLITRTGQGWSTLPFETTSYLALHTGMMNGDTEPSSKRVLLSETWKFSRLET